MQNNKKLLSEILGIDHPILMAPMFLVSNTEMIVAALENGITAAFPAHNYRTSAELSAAIQSIRKVTSKPFGVNLIVNKGNPAYRRQLEVLLQERVDYIITSLGNPAPVIQQAHQLGIKVFCDVVDVRYAVKVAHQGADALIAVTSQAGGHAGPLTAEELIPAISQKVDIPVIAAGGVATFSHVQHMISLGACGVSVGTVFIATHESPVSDAYKQAVVDYHAQDVVLTTKLSGTPCTVIQTPYVKQIGTGQSLLEKILNKNKRLRKWVKMIVLKRGFRKLEKAAFGATYQTVWCAGPAIEHVHEITTVKQVVKRLTANESI